MESREIFKKCPMCTVVWKHRSQFLLDRTLELNGYQANLQKLESGLFYFTHIIDGCCTTMAVQAGDFFDLNPGKRYNERKTGTEDCPGYCLRKDQLDRCHARCECAFVRDVIAIVKDYRNNNRGAELLK